MAVPCCWASFVTVCPFLKKGCWTGWATGLIQSSYIYIKIRHFWPLWYNVNDSMILSTRVSPFCLLWDQHPLKTAFIPGNSIRFQRYNWFLIRQPTQAYKISSCFSRPLNASDHFPCWNRLPPSLLLSSSYSFFLTSVPQSIPASGTGPPALFALMYPHINFNNMLFRAKLWSLWNPWTVGALVPQDCA